MREFINRAGQVVRIIPTDEPFKFRVEIDGRRPDFVTMAAVAMARKERAQ